MNVLFICKNNQFRSQMAAAIYNKLTDTSDAVSAGTYVGIPDNPEGANIQQFFRFQDFFELMEEHGMNIRNVYTRKLTPEMLNQTDIVVSMAEEPFIPDYLRKAKNVTWWNVDNPTLVTRDVAEKTYAEIFGLMKSLL